MNPSLMVVPMIFLMSGLPYIVSVPGVGAACEAHLDNNIGYFGGVETLGECRELQSCAETRGGGGGVLLAGEGPVRVFTSQGQGFGGCFSYSQGELMPYGLPGVILLEIEPLNNEAESNYI